MTQLHLLQSGTLLELSRESEPGACFHAIWLRDNCRCESCGDPVVGRRRLRLTSLDLDVRVDRAELERNPEGDSVRIHWSDGHQGSLSVDWLMANRYDDDARSARRFQPVLWNRDFISAPPDFDFAAVKADDNCFLDLLLTVRNQGLAFLSGAPAGGDTLAPFATRIGYLQENNFGRVQDLVVDHEKRSIANDVQELKPHTDEPYRASPPGIVLFLCIESDQEGGGSSTFLDAFEAAQTLRRQDPEGFAALTRNRQGFRRYFEGDVDLVSEFPLISLDHWGDVCGVRVNDRVHSPTCIPPAELPVYYRGLQQFLTLVEDEDRMIHKKLRPGDIAIFDNHRILHGRTRLSMAGRRWLQWVQLERGDFHSTLRILADRVGRPRDALPLLRGAYS